MRESLLRAALLGVGLFPTLGLAQEASDDDILRTLLLQRDALAEAEEGGGSTRAITLMTEEDLAATAGGLPEVLPETLSEVFVPAGPGVVAAAPDVVPAGPLVADAPAAPSFEGGDEDGVTIAGSADPAIGSDPGSLLALAPDDPATAGATSQPVVYHVPSDDIAVNVRVAFDYDSASLRDDQTPTLDQMCRVIPRTGIEQFRIVGHTDAAGGDLYNERLSLLRAEEVKRYLVETCGLPAESLEAVGMGERFPFDDAEPAAAANRRVEFQAIS